MLSFLGEKLSTRKDSNMDEVRKIAEDLEECAKVALGFTVCDFYSRLAPMEDMEMQLAYKIYKIAEAIRSLSRK